MTALHLKICRPFPAVERSNHEYRVTLRGSLDPISSLICDAVLMMLRITAIVLKYERIHSETDVPHQSFVRTTTAIKSLLDNCERDITKLLEGADCLNPQSSLICRVFIEYMRAVSSSIIEVDLEDMRSMKRSFKEKLSCIDTEFKRRTKEMTSLNGALAKAEQAFERAEGDLKRAHAKAVDPLGLRTAFSRAPSTQERDKQFERMQRLSADQARLASEADLGLNEIASVHSAAYSRAVIVLNEVSSMRRRLNRRVVHQSRQFISRMNTHLNAAISTTVPPLIEQLDQQSPAVGDFGIRLATIEESLRNLLGADREQRVKAMQSKPQLIEYRAVQSYMAKETGELSFSRNERIEVLKKDASGWWTGRNTLGETGVFPSVLVAQRPAGAALPLQQIPAETYRPNLAQNRVSGAWESIGSVDERARMISAQPPFAFVGIVQFAHVGDTLSVDTGEIVQIEGMGDGDGQVKIRNDRGQSGSVPIKILSVKHREESSATASGCHESDFSRLINW